MLKSESFNVYTTDLGEEGVDLGKLYDYDIILLDLNLPDMSGYEVLRTLRLSKVKTPIQMTSRKCQNMERHIRRRLFAGIRPFLATCTISVISQIEPKVTCSPCVPTSVKKAERKPLRCGVAPSMMRWANS